MVLLDDSNSYWWLVRVVKDGSIGYLPAEHIETPTERLARLNKHRNIDLSATMLGDNAEKPKNPLKKAMRRRNAKTVTFASPTYFEASDIDYSTEDDIDDQFFEEEEEDEDDDLEQLDTKDTQEEFKGNDIMVEPLRPKPQIDKDPVRSQIEEPIRQSSEQTREAEEPASQQEEFRHGRSRNGVFRNTDSFFKDDTVETKKISLTPNLLRDDANESSQAIDSKEIKSRGSFEVLIGDRNKDDKKRKEKKPGMLSGLFKRKDKKSKAADDDGEEHEKVSEESSRSSTEHKMSIESLKEETRPTKSQAAPQRNASKLQKVPAVTSPQMTDSMSQNKINLSPSVRAVAPESKEAVAPALRVRTSEPKQEPPLATALESMSHSATSSPVISGSPGTSAPSNEVVEKSAGLPPPPPMAPPPVAPPVALVKEDDKPIPTTDSRSESTLRDSPSNAHAADDLPVSMKRRPSPDEASASTRSLSQPSSDILDTQRTKTENSAPTSAAASPATSPTWDDAGLRAYLDDGSDIRDLLIIVHDNSNVLPAGPDHPIIGSLFKDESKALNEMSNRLDEMLTGWLARRSLAAVR
ncbi:protein phosphatase regulator [Emydomyces testavorans]|uniref:Protein phosphatase regulator n=1 Tax=Emydomyces testavorans TaxID=2070801 RepID=A0AAF0IQA0_9EURO|nr:protein phosphatase regulator [Emydomyces testavorans]